MNNAIVIGAGIGGISASIRLAAAGYRVKVFESESTAGGKLSEFKMNGCRFDFGPSLFTMPEYVEELFTLHHENPKDNFSYSKLDEICKYFFEDGTQFSSFTQLDKFILEIEQKLKYDGAKLREYLNNIETLYDVTSPVFLENPIKIPKTLFQRSFLKGMKKLSSFDLGLNMASANKKRLDNKYLVQYFNRMATYNGSNPFKAPALLNVIAALEHFKGAYFPKGGMYSITKSLQSLAERKGVEFHFDQKVDEIIISQGKAIGVSLGGEMHKADHIICNMDVFMAYKKLLPKVKVPARLARTKPSSSALVYYWGVRGVNENLGLHNIFFSGDYQQEFDYLFTKKQLFKDPTIYIHISSKLEPKDAPENCENWFVMVNAPSLDKSQDWDKIKMQAKEQIIEKLSKMLGYHIGENIFCERVTDPITIESKTSSHRGSIYGTNSNSLLSTFFRHPHKNKSIKNLSFVGGSVHPGGGIPLALLSSKIAVNDLVSE